MDTLPNPHYSKEMVDLLMRIKKHLLAHQDMAIRLSDPALFDKLVKLHPRDDALLQGMLQYLMVLAGPEWSQLYANSDNQKGNHTHTGTGESLGKTLLKKSASLYRGLAAGQGHDSGVRETPAQQAEPAPSSQDTAANPETGENKPRKPVRYYRGQPVPED